MGGKLLKMFFHSFCKAICRKIFLCSFQDAPQDFWRMNFVFFLITACIKSLPGNLQNEQLRILQTAVFDTNFEDWKLSTIRQTKNHHCFCRQLRSLNQIQTFTSGTTRLLYQKRKWNYSSQVSHLSILLISFCTHLCFC